MPQIFDALEPLDPRDSYPLFDPKYQIGGWRDVPTEADLQSIPLERRRAGMHVLVSDTGRLFRLQNNLQGWDSMDLNKKEVVFNSVSEVLIDHNFGYFPNVLVIDISGVEAVVEIVHISTNSVHLYFNKSESGKAILR